MVPPSWAGQRAALVAAGFDSGDFTAVHVASAMGIIEKRRRFDDPQLCDPSTIPIGLFDPAPKVPKEGEDINTLVRQPLFWTDEGRWER
jgi:hypothetical protein